MNDEWLATRFTCTRCRLRTFCVCTKKPKNSYPVQRKRRKKMTKKWMNVRDAFFSSCRKIKFDRISIAINRKKWKQKNDTRERVNPKTEKKMKFQKWKKWRFVHKRFSNRTRIYCTNIYETIYRMKFWNFDRIKNKINCMPLRDRWMKNKKKSLLIKKIPRKTVTFFFKSRDRY